MDHLHASTFGYAANNNERKSEHKLLLKLKEYQIERLEMGSQKCSDRYGNTKHTRTILVVMLSVA
jgi:hypothetical protein